MFNRILRHVVSVCLHVKAHWRHLTNTIEPSVCSSDAILCQIMLITFVIVIITRNFTEGTVCRCCWLGDRSSILPVENLLEG